MARGDEGKEREELMDGNDANRPEEERWGKRDRQMKR